MNDTIIWHNPRCSKSRETLALLEGKDITPQVRRYLDQPPTVDELQEVLRQLGLGPRNLVRKKEALYAELGLATASDDELLRAMVENPVLIERPIVIHGGRAAIGRPPERVLSLLG